MHLDYDSVHLGYYSMHRDDADSVKLDDVDLVL
jgi:hypothetical protein